MLIHENTNIINKNINLGIEILRFCLCFWVLSYHCLNRNKINYFLFKITKTKLYHVPCFSFISFYFSYSIFLHRNINKFKRRIERLLIPYIFWPILIFIINNFPYNRTNISFYQLKIQLVFGRQFMAPLWYLLSVIFLTLLFFILSNLFKTKFLLLTQLFEIFSYIIQYSKYYNFLNEYKNHVKYPILDTLSILPITVSGINFASLNLIEIFKENKTKTLFFSYLFIYMLFKYDIFIELGGYKGIINVFTSISFFIGFYLLPLNNIPTFFKNLIKTLTSYTNGIYCVHSRFINLVRVCFGLEGTFKSCIIYISK